ncbi:MAG: SagB/ThcOx family dehydrogenase [bacterium]|nr:SagB/ThcOx family dehydrogenase [Candidatus Sumerlaeota bacterium]
MAITKYQHYQYACIIMLALAIGSASWAAGDEMSTNPETIMIIDLPTPRKDGAMSVEAALANRRSVREYSSAPLTLGEASQLLWAAQGVTSSDGKRTAPSAGATFPLETYLAAGNVTGLAAGLYKYQPDGHKLKRVDSSDLRAALSGAAYGQEWVNKAPVSIVLTAVYQRTTRRYRQDGIAYAHMEAGHAAQNVYLQSAAMNMGTVIVGAFDAARVKSALKLASDETPLAILPVGRR